MTNLNNQIRRKSWSHFWQQGQLHSLASSMPDNYQGAIANFWQRELESLTTEHAILDIGTGNGALPAMIFQIHQENMPEIDAIDLAEIAPAWTQELPEKIARRLRFHGNTQAESLPFPNASFDLCISQYGFEYTHLDTSSQELARVLKPGCRLSLVLHHADSHLVTVAREELRHNSWLRSDASPLIKASQVLPYLQMASQGRVAELAQSPSANTARSNLNQAMQALSAIAAQSAYPDLLHESAEFIAQALGSTGNGIITAEHANQRLQHYQQALEQAALRHQELCSCAMDDKGIVHMQNLLTQHGIKDIDIAILKENNYLLGWTLTARKSS